MVPVLSHLQSASISDPNRYGDGSKPPQPLIPLPPLRLPSPRDERSEVWAFAAIYRMDGNLGPV